MRCLAVGVPANWQHPALDNKTALQIAAAAGQVCHHHFPSHSCSQRDMYRAMVFGVSPPFFLCPQLIVVEFLILNGMC